LMVLPNQHSANEQNPFGGQQRNSRTISLTMMFCSMIFFAGVSLLMMMASRVPVLANGINEFFGWPENATSEKPDRSTHLFFLLFCYASPLLFAMWVGLLHSIIRRTLGSVKNKPATLPQSPFA
jgi:hypothetical protein